MKTNTSHITVGVDPALTIAIVTAIAIRRERQARRAAFVRLLQFWKR